MAWNMNSFEVKQICIVNTHLFIKLNVLLLIFHILTVFIKIDTHTRYLFVSLFNKLYYFKIVHSTFQFPKYIKKKPESLRL